MFRFSVKIGLATGVVYYLKEEGVWKESDEALKVYEKLNTALESYIKDAKNQIPIELPAIPNYDKPSFIVKQYWNKGVIYSFHLLSNLPNKVSTLTQQGVNSVLENPDVQKLWELATGSKSQPDE